VWSGGVREFRDLVRRGEGEQEEEEEGGGGGEGTGTGKVFLCKGRLGLGRGVLWG